MTPRVLAVLVAGIGIPLAAIGTDTGSGIRAGESSAVSGTQYILFNRAPGQGMNQGVPDSLGRKQFEEVLAPFPNRPEARIQTGLSFIFSPFRTPPETTLRALGNFLGAAEQTATPVLVQIDTEHWWEARPDLWNWWDPARPGFDPANRENVEWTGWSPESALKMAWRNWGRQIRVLPPPNLASPRYATACREEIRRLIPVILDWQARLPQDKKHLFIGIKVGHETSIGVNAYHFPAGNEWLARPATEDPNRPLNTDDVLARGMAQIGYAALKSSGIRTNGLPAEGELRDVAQGYLEMLCREAAGCGVPRERLFAHGAGWKEGELIYDAPMNRYACPGWSFYQHAADPRRDTGVQRNLAKSDAPYWAATEWLFQGARTTEAWRGALANTLSDPRCRYVCIFNWESIRSDETVLKSITGLVEAGGRPSYGASPVIKHLEMEPGRHSLGDGDNWPITWADDGSLYTVYCDGKGFGGGSGQGSMSLARVTGTPPEHGGENIASATAHRVGDGHGGRKASGLLMVDGVLYMWVRNLKPDGTGSSLAWSSDHARTWIWAEWSFPEIGYPVWLNAGRNYEVAPDDYAYLYAPESPSAYRVSDHMLLGRVPRGGIREKDNYQFFAGLDRHGNPRWSCRFEERQPVFSAAGRCYRPEAVYHPGLKRYLLCTATSGSPEWCGTEEKYLGIFDAPAPWGPWTVGKEIPGWGGDENRFQPRIPTKWISADDGSFWLLYSCFPKGPYQFNVQRCTLTVQP